MHLRAGRYRRLVGEVNGMCRLVWEAKRLLRRLTSRNNLASTLKTLGAPEDAKTLQQEVVEASQRTLGAEHPDTLTFKNNLALTLQDLDALEDAKRLQQEMLETEERTFGAKHLNTQISKSNLASTLQALEAPEDAARL